MSFPAKMSNIHLFLLGKISVVLNADIASQNEGQADTQLIESAILHDRLVRTLCLNVN